MSEQNDDRNDEEREGTESQPQEAPVDDPSTGEDEPADKRERELDVPPAFDPGSR